MSIITIKTLKDGRDFNFNVETGVFDLAGKIFEHYLPISKLKDSALLDKGFTHYISIDYRVNMVLTPTEASIAQHAIDDYRAQQNKLHANVIAKNKQQKALNLLLSEGYDDGSYSLNKDDDTFNSAA